MKRSDREKFITAVCSTIEAAYGKLKPITKFNAKNVRSVLDVAEATITMVEDYNDDVKKLTGPNKKKLAVDILNRIINVKLKYVPNVLREKIEGYIINLIIEFIITMFNKYIGKRWLKRGE